MATTLQSLPALTPPAAPTLALAQDDEATATGSQSAMPRSPQVASPLDADQDSPPRPSLMVPSRSSSIRSSARSQPASPALALQQLPLEPSPPQDSTISPPPGISSDEADGDTTPDSSSPPTPPSRPRPRPQSLSFASKAPSLSHPQDQLYTASAQRRSPPRRGSALCSLQAAAASVAAAASAAESTGSGGSAYSTSFSANTLPSLSSSKSLSRATTISSPPRYHLQQQQQQQQQQRHQHPGLASSPTSPPPADYYIRKRTQSTTLPELRRSRTLHTAAPTTSHYTSLDEAAAAAAAAAAASGPSSASAGSPPFGRGYDQQTHASTLRARGRRLSSTTVAGLPSAESKLSIRDRTPLSRAGDVGGNSSSTISRRDGSQRLTAPPAATEDTSTTPTPRPLTNLEAKVVILGAQGVGKTSIVHRYTSGHFSSTTSVPSTIGASFLTKKLVVDNVKCRLQIWDTAGQERYRAMAPMYYRNAHAAVLVYDVTSRESLGEVRLWVEELRRNVGLEGEEDGREGGGGLVLHVVGAKADLADRQREVSMEEAREQLLRWLVPERQRVVDALEEEREQLAVQQAVADAAAAAAGGGSMPTSATMSRLSSLSSLAMGTAASRLGVAFPSVSGTAANNASTSSLPLGGGGGSSTSKRPTFSRFPTNTSTSNVAAGLAADSSLSSTGAGSGGAGGPASSDGSAEGGASGSILPLGLPPLPTPGIGSSSSPPLAQSSYFAANHSSSSIHAATAPAAAAAAATVRLPGDNLDLLLSEVSAKDDSPEALCAIEEVFVSITERLVHRRGLEMQRLREMRRRDSIFLGGEEGEDEDEEEGVEGQMGSRRGGGRAGSSIRSKKGENGWSCC